MNAPVIPLMEVCPDQPVRFHDLANLFPWLDSPAMDRLREDIRQHGVREPVVFLDGAILDGRNRYQCARDLGLPYPRREFGSDPADGDDPRAFVVSVNLHRRHLTESQRAVVAGKLANMRQGERTDLEPSANLPKVSQSEAADMLNVSERSVSTAKKVIEQAAPEVVEAVERGDLSVSLAAKATALPREDQAAIVRDAGDRKALQKSVLAAVADGARRPSNRNPHHVPDGQRDRVIRFTGDCRRIAEADDLDKLARFDGHPEFRRQMIAEARSAFAALTLFIQKVEEV